MTDHSAEVPARPVPVLVLGGGITGLGVLRILARDRIPAWIVAPPGDLALWSRHARPAPGSAAAVAPREDLAAWLEGSPLAQAVLIPCSDAWAGAVSRLADPIRRRFPVSIAGPEALEQALDKGRFADLLRRIDVPHPRTWPVEQGADLSSIPDDAFAHGFLKPRDSQRFFARYGVKGFWVASRDAAAARLDELGRERIGVQFQEYVPGPPTNHVFVDGFADAGGAVRALLVRRRLRMYPTDFGNSTAMVTMPPDEAAPAVDAVRRMVAGMRFRGIFSVEFKRSVVDGRYYALEMNARPWWYVDYAARAGVDVVRLAWLDAQGLPVPETMTYRLGFRCVYPYYDWHAVRALRARHEASVATWLRAVPGADQPVWRWSDPVPGLRHTWAMLRSRLGRAKGTS